MKEKTRTLSSILTPLMGGFPSIGKNGYAGEQDGSRVVLLGVLQVSSRKEAEKIHIGDAIDIHWASYNAKHGWLISLAHWDDEDEKDCYVRFSDARAKWIH